MDLVLFSAIALVVLLTVLTSVMVYVSRSILDSSKSKRQKALWVLGVTALLLIVAVVGLGLVLSPFASAFD
ncbi:MAG TPA: hypothetical protein VFO99_19445 [Pyrinomonadaceae bacterium]|nr:hypothetical protein [Pyrinomonadaceae bacterium]